MVPCSEATVSPAIAPPATAVALAVATIRPPAPTAVSRSSWVTSWVPRHSVASPGSSEVLSQVTPSAGSSESATSTRVTGWPLVLVTVKTCSTVSPRATPSPSASEVLPTAREISRPASSTAATETASARAVARAPSAVRPTTRVRSTTAPAATSSVVTTCAAVQEAYWRAMRVVRSQVSPTPALLRSTRSRTDCSPVLRTR